MMNIFRYRAVIIDDEPPARLRMAELLKRYSESISIVGEAESGTKGIELIERNKPDFVFLDIQLQDMDGFEMLSRLDYKPFVIFTTAYDQFAIDAFQVNSIDYLVKPIDEMRFEQCVQKILSIGAFNNDVNFEKLRQFFFQIQPKKIVTALPIRLNKKIILVRFSDMIFCEAKDGNVIIKTAQGKDFVTELTLNHLEEKLPEGFLRVQKSFIVNKEKIIEIRRHFNNRLILVMDDNNRTSITTGIHYIQKIRESLGI